LSERSERETEASERAKRARGAGTRKKLQQIIPWLIALLLLGWLFQSVDAEKVKQALAGVPAAAFFALMAAYVLLTWLADSFATWIAFARALPDQQIPLGEILQIRGATYLLGIIHYAVGQGGVAYFLHLRRKVDLARTSGAVVLTLAVNAMMTAICAFLGVASGSAPDRPALRWLVILLACSFPVYMAVIAAAPRFLKKIPFLRPLFDAGLKGHLVAIASRLPHITVIVVGSWVLMLLFGVNVPFGKALALLPIVFVVGVLPISPSGLGTTQTVAVWLFSPFAGTDPDAARARVLAFGLATQIVALMMQALLGLVFLRKVTAGSRER
jgi:uncharacterized membrane protein YbhN (UPF0104 family)